MRSSPLRDCVVFSFSLLTFEGEKNGVSEANLQVVVLNDVSVFVESNVAELELLGLLLVLFWHF